MVFDHDKGEGIRNPKNLDVICTSPIALVQATWDVPNNGCDTLCVDDLKGLQREEGGKRSMEPIYTRGRPGRSRKPGKT